MSNASTENQTDETASESASAPAPTAAATKIAAARHITASAKPTPPPFPEPTDAPDETLPTEERRAVSEAEITAGRLSDAPEAPAATAAPAGADRLNQVAQALAAAGDDTLDKILSVLGGEPVQDETPALPASDARLSETITVDVYDATADDYVSQTMTRGEFLRLSEPQDQAGHDFSALGRAYHEGDNARFDYYWADESDRGMQDVRRKGWVPVKKSLDRQHNESDGAVRMGQSVLCRRPKADRGKWNEFDRAAAEALVGSPESEMTKAANGEANVFSDGYQVDENPDRVPGQGRPVSADVVAEMQDRAKVAKSGKKSFYFERNPIWEEKQRKAAAEAAGQAAVSAGSLPPRA